MLDLPSLSRPLRRHVCKMLRKKTKTRTKKQKATKSVQFSAVCWCLFLAGWNDGTVAHCYPVYRKCMMCVIRLSRYALFVTYFVPRLTLQLYLWFLSLLVSQVPFSPSALLLLTTKLQGFILGALANVHLTHQFGLGNVGMGADLKRFEIWVLTWLCDRPLFWVRWLWQHVIFFCSTWKCLGSILQIIAYAYQSPFQSLWWHSLSTDLVLRSKLTSLFLSFWFTTLFSYHPGRSS